MAIVHDRVPDPTTYPPLPDIFLDALPSIEWAFPACEVIILSLSLVLTSTLVFHKHRFVILRRFCAITGTVFLLRCMKKKKKTISVGCLSELIFCQGLTMFVTSLSVPGKHLVCDVRVGASLEEKLAHAWLLITNLALSINGVRTCGDYMFSGHTSMITLINYFIK